MNFMCHTSLKLCTIRTIDAPLHNLVHYSCTTTYSRTPISCTTHTRAPISCITPTRAPLPTRALLRNLMHYSCTAMYSRAPISCTTRTRAAISCTTPTRVPFSCSTPTRAPLVLVHHSALVHLSIISCTTRAPLRTLVHH